MSAQDIRDIRDRQIRDQTRRQLIGYLARGSTAETIGQKVILMDFILNQQPELLGGTQKELGERLGLAKSSVSERLSTTRRVIDEMRNPNFESSKIIPV